MNSTSNPHNTNPINDSLNNSNVNSHSTTTTSTWKLITHNIQGFNDKTKQLIWNDYCIKNNIDIAIITETQINSQTSTKYWKFKKYDSWWNNSTKGAGILLLIKKEIAHHIFKIQTFPGRGICADLNFKGKTTIRIIGIYYPSSQKPE